MGAQTVNASAEDVAKMHHFGELIGMAFQIKDDLFDYGSRNIGKPTGIDIKEQKMTLPLIYTLNKVGSKDKRWLINSIKNHNRDKRRVREVIDKVKQEGGLEFAIEKMQFYREEALAVLDGFQGFAPLQKPKKPPVLKGLDSSGTRKIERIED